MSERKNILLRLDPAVHDALARWAGDELRSTTAQIEYLLRQALLQGGRMPGNAGGLPRRGRPAKEGGKGGANGANGEPASGAGNERTEDREGTHDGPGGDIQPT